MNITQHFLAFTLLGAAWVLWLLVGLSVVSFAIMIERAWFYARTRVDAAALGADLRPLIASGELEKARACVSGGESAEAHVLSAGLAEAERGVAAVSEAMSGQKARERLRLERNLAFLGTLGNNAPFIGLFGTVIGIIQAFHDLAGNQAGGMSVVMTGVAEALVATAMGLIVAIPAVVGFNYFNRRVRGTLTEIDALAHLVLAQLKGEAPAPKASASGAH